MMPNYFPCVAEVSVFFLYDLCSGCDKNDGFEEFERPEKRKNNILNPPKIYMHNPVFIFFSVFFGLKISVIFLPGMLI